MSNEIKEYIRKLSHTFHLPPLVLSSSAKRLLEKVGAAIKRGLSLRNVPRAELHVGTLQKGAYYEMMPHSIKDVIENSEKVLRTWRFSMDSRDFVVHITYIGQTGGTRLEKVFQTYFRRIYAWFYVASLFSKEGQCSPTLTVNIFLTGALKKLPRLPGETIGQDNVNTGFTYSCRSPTNEIYIYREEEWFKVLIHETFHSFHLDFSSMDENIANQIILPRLRKMVQPLDLRFYESYTETWAEIIHTLFFSVIGKSSFIKNMNMERLFSQYQCANILQYNGLSYTKLWKGVAKKEILNYREGSPVISYYVVKSCLTFHLGDFLDWCAIQLDESFQFIHDADHIQSLCSFYLERSHSNDYVTLLNRLGGIVLKKRVFDSLRMTVLEIDV
jgi:hypothetical protein